MHMQGQAGACRDKQAKGTSHSYISAQAAVYYVQRREAYLNAHIPCPCPAHVLTHLVLDMPCSRLERLAHMHANMQRSSHKCFLRAALLVCLTYLHAYVHHGRLLNSI